MMIKEAIHSIRKDWNRAVCFWVVFMLSSMFLYLIFHVSLSDAVGVSYIYGRNDLPTYLTTFDATVCIIVIFMANHFYVKKKSGELAVILMCGGTYLQLMGFLLIQTGILMAVSIPVGVAAGKMCFPLIGSVFHRMTGRRLSMASGDQPVVLLLVIIAMEIFWCTLVNLGYSYRSSIYTLLNGEKKITVRFPFLKLPILKGLRCGYPLLYLGCAVLLYGCGSKPEQMTVLGVMGMIGLCKTIDKIILPWLEAGGAKDWIDQGEKLVPPLGHISDVPLFLGGFRPDSSVRRPLKDRVWP